MAAERTNTVEREAPAARRAGGLEPARSLGEPLPARARLLLSLQQSAGNRAVSGLVQRWREGRGDVGLLQGRFAPIQGQGLEEEEEPLQGRFAPVQLQGLEEEEEPLQGRFAPAQLQGLEDEEELQLRAAPSPPAQLQPEPVPRRNDTGLPDGLKSGVESLSGISLDDVEVHYNSAEPARLDALAYAQGTDIHVAPGQEQHLPHEAWHVVQQAQGRVKPTMQLQDGVPVNDDQELEHEAEAMGARASLQQSTQPEELQMSAALSAPIQRELQDGRSDAIAVQRLLSEGAWKTSTGVKVGKRGGNNPELLQIDALIAQYHTYTDQNDPDLEHRFQTLTDVELTVYSWYNRRFNTAKPKNSARLTAMYDLLDDVAAEHERLVSRTVDEGKDLPIPSVGNDQVEKGGKEYTKIQAMWKAIVNETGNINFTLQDAKKQEDYPDFKKNMLPHLAKLLRTPTGRGLIRGLLETQPTGLSDEEKASGKGTVTIRPTGQGERDAGRVAAAGPKKMEAYQTGDTRSGGGKGMGSYLSASPVGTETSVTRAGAGVDVRGNPLLSPMFIVLAHEMIHVLHNLMGENCKGTALADWQNLEEKLTITGRDENDKLVNQVSEQGMRGDYGLQQERFGH